MTLGDTYGSSVAEIGDVNGDGIPDVAIGAPGDDGLVSLSDMGTVYIMFGATNGMADSVQEINFGATPGDTYGSAVAGAGDFNGERRAR